MRFSVALLAALACACGPGLNDLTIDAAPVGSVKAKVDVAALRAGGYDGAFLIGLGWARSSSLLEGACTTYTEYPEVMAQCGDPFAVNLIRRRGGTSFPLMRPLVTDADGVATIVLDSLPPADASAGTGVGRVAYGSVLVGSDANGDGEFFPWPDPFGGEADRLMAASFTSLLKPQQRLVLREGLWNPLSFFYPLLGCEAPPPVGFSRAVATLDLSGDKPSGECEITDIEVPIEVTPLTEDEGALLLCESWVVIANPDWFMPEPLPGEPVPELPEGTCLSEDIYFIGNEGLCGGGTVVPLRGCFDGGECESPDWDVSDDPPEWWPCE